MTDAEEVIVYWCTYHRAMLFVCVSMDVGVGLSTSLSTLKILPNKHPQPVYNGQSINYKRFINMANSDLKWLFFVTPSVTNVHKLPRSNLSVISFQTLHSSLYPVLAAPVSLCLLFLEHQKSLC